MSREPAPTAADPILTALDAAVRAEPAATAIATTLARVVQQLDEAPGLMAWDVIPLEAFSGLPESIRSCWIFVIRAGAATTPERHPNSRQRSFSLIGRGTFEVHAGGRWTAHPLESVGTEIRERWISIPPSTWHRLRVGFDTWGMASFHTVPSHELIEEKPIDPDDLQGRTHQERYSASRASGKHLMDEPSS